MITHALTVSRSQVSARVFLLGALLFLSMSAIADDTGDTRLSVSIGMTTVEREQGVSGSGAEHEYSALQTQGERSLRPRSMSLSKSEQFSTASANVDFWFYTADVELFNDHDRDGYYHGIDLLFDADTYYAFAEVYAVVYLSLDGGPWNEYAVTEDFTLIGASSEDEYIIVTELVSGYPAGSYDILIELFDAYDNSFLAWYGPEDTSELAFLPLEDANRDVATPPDVIVVNRGGGGSSGVLFTMTLLLVALRRIRHARFA